MISNLAFLFEMDLEDATSPRSGTDTIGRLERLTPRGQPAAAGRDALAVYTACPAACCSDHVGGGD